MSIGLKYCLIVGLIIALIAVRAFLEPLFYDPLNVYFKSDYLNLDFPELVYLKYFTHTSIRFATNTFLSIGIIYLLFQNKSTFNFTLKLYAAIYIILISFLFEELMFNLSNGYLFLFYVRRLLIHPIILLILLPAFYYQQQMERSRTLFL